MIGHQLRRRLCNCPRRHALLTLLWCSGGVANVIELLPSNAPHRNHWQRQQKCRRRLNCARCSLGFPGISVSAALSFASGSNVAPRRPQSIVTPQRTENSSSQRQRGRWYDSSPAAAILPGSFALLDVKANPAIRVRFHIVRNACIEYVGEYQSCMVSKLRIIWKQTVASLRQAHWS